MNFEFKENHIRILTILFESVYYRVQEMVDNVSELPSKVNSFTFNHIHQEYEKMNASGLNDYLTDLIFNDIIDVDLGCYSVNLDSLSNQIQKNKRYEEIIKKVTNVILNYTEEQQEYLCEDLIQSEIHELYPEITSLYIIHKITKRIANSFGIEIEDVEVDYYPESYINR